MIRVVAHFYEHLVTQEWEGAGVLLNMEGGIQAEKGTGEGSWVKTTSYKQVMISQQGAQFV